MNNKIFSGIEVNRLSIKELLLNRGMIIGLILFAVGIFGVYEVFAHRYLLLTANSFDAGLNPGSKEIALAMKEAVFGSGGEVLREAPWTLYIVNYMYMIYTGSGIIFFVALAEILNVEIIKKSAAGFLAFGLSMVIGGLFTIAIDLNIFHMQWMVISPNITAGMWLMLPLYIIYIPFVLFEIYLLITMNQVWAKRIAFGILVLSIVIDIVEFYIQAKLFDMNTARHLWTTYPVLSFYFIVSAFVAAIAVMTLFSFIKYKNTMHEEFDQLIGLLRISALYAIALLAVYEATAYLFIDKEWGAIILFGKYKIFFYCYLLLTVAFPFALEFRTNTSRLLVVMASISVIFGTYLGRYIFVYGGNAYPMSDRFAAGFEKYSEYDQVKEFIFYPPNINEVYIVIGSIGVILVVFRILDGFFNVSKIREH